MSLFENEGRVKNVNTVEYFWKQHFKKLGKDKSFKTDSRKSQEHKYSGLFSLYQHFKKLGKNKNFKITVGSNEDAITST